MTSKRVALCLLISACTLVGSASLSGSVLAAGKARQFDGFAQKNALESSVGEDESDRGAIGIKFVVRSPRSADSRVFVLHVVPDSPAAMAGLQKDDVIVGVDGKPVAGLDSLEFSKLIRGEPGTRVGLTVERKNQTLSMDVVRGGLRSLTDADFRNSLTHQYEDEERKQRFVDAQEELMWATGRESTFAAASPKLHENTIVTVCNSTNEARFAMQRGDYPSAEKRLRAALKDYPGFWQARFMLALLFDLQGRFEESRVELRQVVAAAPKSLDAWLALALSEHILGDRSAALVAYKKAALICNEPKDEKAIRIKISALQEEIAKQGTQSKTAPELVAQARQLIRASDYEQAERLLRQAVAVDSKFSPAWQVLGEVQQKQGDTDEALDSLKNAFDANTGDVQLGQLIASAVHADPASAEVNKTVEALKSRVTSASANENLNWARIALGYFYMQQANWDGALEQYKQLLARNDIEPKERAMLMVGSGICCEYGGRFIDARDFIEKAIQIDPGLNANAEVQQSLAMLHEVIRTAKLSPDTPDYVSEIPYSNLCRWNIRKPVKVYIAPPPPGTLPTYRDTFDARLRGAFDKWAEALGGQLKFVFVSKPSGAHIRCDWTDDKTKLAGAHRLAVTKVTFEGHRIQRAQIILLTTTSPERTVALNDDEVYRSALHEVGHALGLSAHSTNNHDIMFPFSSNMLTSLSDRDIRTITALYSLPEPKDNTAQPSFTFIAH